MAEEQGRKFQHPLSLPLHHSILILSLLASPFRYRRALSLALIICTFPPLILRPYSPDPALSYGIATLWVFTLRVLTIHVFSRPTPEAALYRPQLEPPGAAAGYSLPKKLRWTLSLLVAQRNVGWNNSVVESTAAQQRRRGRWGYAAYVLTKVLGIYLLLDISRTIVLQQEWMLPLDHPAYRPLGDPRRSIPARLVDVATNGGSAWGYMELQYLLLSLIFVGLGDDEASWPPLFGSLWDAYSVQRLWGQVWHRMLRSSLVSWGRAVADCLGIREGTARFLVVVGTSFTISAVGHASAIWTADKSLGGGALRFFLMQAAGVGVETGVVAVWRRVGGGNVQWGKWVGYAWTLAWLTYTCPMQAEEMVTIGLFKTDPVPWSVTRWALGMQ
ncbi:membrane bound O-acyl transferase family-domain-containing protein [Tricharina praecox]|uniref:membrane bound O-acyl transferase family-domain-containing protein n=1 Tax=Tricharina praecox TaxID=43433 RepID=UPI00221F5C21|nr:membrane bound O-acyl transferase family-domain-containing protein [Tricharina praecox]KAI5855836.1 membrane bound O-acyl transferase family-domain-containing protein [Tricharina praecox]